MQGCKEVYHKVHQRQTQSSQSALLYRFNFVSFVHSLVNFVFKSFYLFPDIDNKSHSDCDTLNNFVFDLLIIGSHYFSISLFPYFIVQ